MKKHQIFHVSKRVLVSSGKQHIIKTTFSSLLEGKGNISQIRDTFVQTLPHDEKHQLTYIEANPALTEPQ